MVHFACGDATSANPLETLDVVADVAAGARASSSHRRVEVPVSLPGAAPARRSTSDLWGAVKSSQPGMPSPRVRISVSANASNPNPLAHPDPHPHPNPNLI